MKGKLLIFALTVALACVAALRVAEAGGGLLNNSFGTGGRMMMQLTGTSDYVQAVVTQPDGRIVGVGSAGSSPLVVRFQSDGQLDTGFGSGGVVIPAPLTIARGVALQADGKILVAGSAPFSSGGPGGLSVARLNSNGSLDTGFGNGGVAPALIFNGRGDYATSIALQPDGKIVLAGIAGIAYQDSDFAVARYNSDGSPDNSFGSGGKVNTSFGGSRDQAYAVVIQSDGKIVVSGDGTVSNYEVDFALARYMPNGTPDATFDGDGKLTTSFFFQNFARAYALTIQPDGRILAAGSAGVVGDYRFGLARYNADGQLDTSFGTNGVQTLTFPGYARADGHGLALQADGKILVGGDAFSYSEDYNFALARFTSNGQLDTSFGNAGRVTTNFGAEDVAYAMSLQSNGHILLAGQTGEYPDYAIALASYTNDAAVRRNAVADYDGDGSSDLSVFRPNGGMWFLLQSTAGFRAQAWGATGDVLVPADYDGDGKTDVAVFRQGTWYILRSTDGTLRAQAFGQSGDVPVPGDFDGDGRNDPAVFRQGNWYALGSTDGALRAQAWGIGTDSAVPADYDGDGRTDFAVFRNGTWYELFSSNGQLRTQAFGQSGDVLVAGDYDGDGRSDAAVFRQGTWYVLHSSDNSFSAQSFGLATDRAVPADYDGDGKVDLAVYRDGAWYILRSSNGSLRAEGFGASGDLPAAGWYAVN